MIQAADIRAWRNHDVIDPKGHKIGVLEAIYVDTTTDEPAMATVGVPLMAVFLLIVLVAVVLGLVGATVAGLSYLLVIGIVLLVADLALAAVRLSRRSRRRLLR